MRDKNKMRLRRMRASDPRRILLYAARNRATQRGLPFNLTLEDIVVPLTCPVLGIPLSRGTRVTHDGSPQLDRLVPELGYIRGNVVVISKLANTIKQNASPNQIRAVADWYERAVKSLLLQEHKL